MVKKQLEETNSIVSSIEDTKEYHCRKLIKMLMPQANEDTVNACLSETLDLLSDINNMQYIGYINKVTQFTVNKYKNALVKKVVISNTQ